MRPLTRDRNWPTATDPESVAVSLLDVARRHLRLNPLTHALVELLKLAHQPVARLFRCLTQCRHLHAYCTSRILRDRSPHNCRMRIVAFWGKRPIGENGR